MTLETVVQLWREVEPELLGCVKGLLRRYGLGTDAAEDVVQSTFVKLLGQDRLEEIDEGRFRQLVFWLAGKVALDWRRKESAEKRALRKLQETNGQQGLRSPLHEIEARELLDSAITEAGLTELEAQAVFEYLEAGGSRQEATRNMGLTDDEAIQNQYDQPKCRALRKLRECGFCWRTLEAIRYDRSVEFLFDVLKGVTLHGHS